VTTRERQVLALLAAEADPAFRSRAAWSLARAGLLAGERLLDLGAAEATMTRLAGALAAVKSIALDVSLSRLLRARANDYRGAAVVADATRLPFRDGSFDVILACEVLEHVEDDARALAEARRVARPSARLAVTVPHASYPWSWDPLARWREKLGLEPLRTGWYVGIWYGHRRLYREDDLHRRIERAGWRIASRARLSRGGLPFAHFLLYGVGRRLLDAGWVRGSAATGLERRRLGAPLPPAWTPLGGGVRLMRLAAARADRARRSAGAGASVGLAVMATRNETPGLECAS
jgi:ubiquinone/menaquinone biosynthesis C-methylase UbiE